MIKQCKKYRLYIAILLLIFIYFSAIFMENKNLVINDKLKSSNSPETEKNKDNVFVSNNKENKYLDFIKKPIIFIGGYARSGTTLMR
jgi:hypothetical protein